MAWIEEYRTGYRGRYKDAQGRNRTAGRSTSKRKALALARAEEEKIRKGSWVDPDVGKMTFSDYFENQWIKSRVREVNTVAAYRSHYSSSLKETFGSTQLRRISSGMVQAWVKEMSDAGVRPGTIRAKFRTLSTVLGARTGRSAVRDRLIEQNPCSGVDLPTSEPREVTIYQPKELVVLAQHLDDWWKPMLLLAAETGMRWGELLAYGDVTERRDEAG